MRAISGWRFLLVIVFPILLATLSAVGLTYDLLWQVENSGNATERARNTVVLKDVFDEDLKELERITRENARWDVAARETAGSVNEAWFKSTWGQSISVGSAYDFVAVIDQASGNVLIHNLVEKNAEASLQDFIGMPFDEMKKGILAAPDNAQSVSGHAMTKWGPAAIALSAIRNPYAGNAPSGRYLLMYKAHSERRLANLGRRHFLMGLHVDSFADNATSALRLKGLAGAPPIMVTWLDKDLGAFLTQSGWQKAGVVLGFLIVVMTGIAIVCLRLLRHLSEKEEEASYSAAHDHLTGLANRRSLMAELKALNGKPHTLVFADLDGFKEVNDSFGHEYGDRLICMVAKGIEQLAVKSRLVGRLGGDEFVVLYDGVDGLLRGKELSSRMIKMLAQPFNMEGRMAAVGASIGISQAEDETDENEVLRRADIAMYKAKADGKNRYCVYDQSFDLERQENIAIAGDLKRILDTRDLDIAFQPVVSARNGAICGVEALARWPKSAARQVTADRFIAVAENSGLIDQLGGLILDKACAEAKAWPHIRLAVNISAVQLNNPRFVEQALSIIAMHGISPNRLEFEITETSLIQDADRAKHVFKALQGVGIKVALDDFGTGFSSIGYLRRFQFDRIKIDKSITNKMLSSPAELAVVQGVLLVARGLSLDVTAEGVESDEEVQVLKLAGCTELQGFHYYKAMEAPEVTRLLAQNRAQPPALTQVVPDTRTGSLKIASAN
jgi:diguanylate cyclase (GGDEF)-like protein